MASTAFQAMFAAPKGRQRLAGYPNHARLSSFFPSSLYSFFIICPFSQVWVSLVSFTFLLYDSPSRRAKRHHGVLTLPSGPLMPGPELSPPPFFALPLFLRLIYLRFSCLPKIPQTVHLMLPKYIFNYLNDAYIVWSNGICGHFAIFLWSVGGRSKGITGRGRNGRLSGLLRARASSPPEFQDLGG